MTCNIRCVGGYASHDFQQTTSLHARINANGFSYVHLITNLMIRASYIDFPKERV
jgi:hypothetical protein